MIISQSLASRLSPKGEAPVGTVIQIAGESSPLRITGIVNDLVLDEPRPYVYRPISASEAKEAPILIHVSGDPRPVKTKAVSLRPKRVAPGFVRC